MNQQTISSAPLSHSGAVCTLNTVKTNKKRLFKKLNVKFSHEAITVANTYNLLDH